MAGRSPEEMDPGEENVDKSVPSFWSGRYQQGDAHWELPIPSPSADAEMRFGLLHELGVERGDRVLVPGCGRGRDLLLFTQRSLVVDGIDFAQVAVDDANARLAERGIEGRVFCEDVFAFGGPDHDGQYALVFDHTCCCALPRDRHAEYGAKVASWLRPGGHLVHVAFPADPDRPFEQGPPFRMMREDCDLAFADALCLVASREPMVSHPRRHGRERIDVWQKA